MAAQNTDASSTVVNLSQDCQCCDLSDVPAPAGNQLVETFLQDPELPVSYRLDGTVQSPSPPEESSEPPKQDKEDE
ncbi:hypothetical protein G7Z17_g9529 [Cylindrodendrum hubeiense]|uniref:Uncharacterized protein n=1 Tax=Cylindrodendrum hubeiense TaxID=595255 RepID=A0A9P5H089_9HYPO|nr:hypothetical protein G7Z17_g9529 [Cylindrodendrum hubeiense]